MHASAPRFAIARRLLPGFPALAASILCSFVAQGAPSRKASPIIKVSGFPEIILENRHLRVRCYLPSAEWGYYRGTRFDYSGMISSVEYRGHRFFSEFSEQHDPYNHDDVCGTAEEFGMTSLPSGFLEAGPGETFLKIGVGALEKTKDPTYGFWKKYRIVDAGERKVTAGKTWARFEHRVQTTNGYGYDYVKTIRLQPLQPALRIERRLRNTGSKTLQTDHYGHHFVQINGIPAGPGYRLEFPFEPKFNPDARGLDWVNLAQKNLSFTSPVPTGEAVWAPLSGYSGRRGNNRFRIVEELSGASMTVVTDRHLSRFVLYSSRGVLCPEPFVLIELQPAEQTRWTTGYRFAGENIRKKIDLPRKERNGSQRVFSWKMVLTTLVQTISFWDLWMGS